MREEKAVVQQISKLNSQRGKLREYETQKASLAELESESSKVTTCNCSVVSCTMPAVREAGIAHRRLPLLKQKIDKLSSRLSNT